ncbi:MAG: transglycosylase family protein [Micrococcaceae bacterium]|nr:transglycosylase family protein [Micrococcaceae bacterium]
MIQQNSKKFSKISRIGASSGVAALALAGAAAGIGAAPASAAPAGTWDSLAQCESGGDWSINTGNGFKGGLQFTNSTWKAFGGSGQANHASKSEQIRVAKKVQAAQGGGAWPACSAKLGISGKAPSGPKQATKKAPVQKAAPKQAPVQKAAPKHTAQAPVQKAAPQQQVKSTGKHVATVKATDSGKNYTVKAGDTLSKIANAQGLSGWEGLYSVNTDTVSNPNVIMVGQTINLPTK